MNHGRRFLFLACCVAAFAVAAASGQGEAASWPSNVKVSQDHDGNPQAETSLAADPNDPNHLVAVWWEVVTITPERWDKRVNYAWSRDGGRTWANGRLDTDEYSSDPAIVADSHGNFYIETVVGDVFADDFPTGDSISIFRSTDGGETFSLTNRVAIDEFIDKPFIAVDPVSDALYLTWTFIAPKRSTNAFQIHLAASYDHGATFTEPRVVSSNASRGSMAVPIAGLNGEIYVVWGGTFNGRIWFDRSPDGGQTWLRSAVLVAAMNHGEVKGTGFPYLFPAVAVDRSDGPHRGRIYVVWRTVSFFNDSDIHLAWSDDRGDHWSNPVRVNDDAVGNGALQFLEWVVVDHKGGVHVTFLDLRLASDVPLRAEYMATSTDGGVTFGPNIRVSDGWYAPTRFWGDYNQPVAAGDRVHAIWADARLGHNEVFTQSMELDDFDEDGVLNDGDNCPGTPNADQADGDGDHVGDACDNCPATPNTNQWDIDRDGIGDACDGAP